MGLKDEDIAAIFEAFLKKYHPNNERKSLDAAFCNYFRLPTMPEVLNESHELVVVASALDDRTERIVSYLSKVHGVPVNAVFFRTYHDGGREYITRIWLIEPTEVDTPPESPGDVWNGEYYVSFGNGERRQWEDAVKYGFISGGGGPWYSGTLHLLEPQARVWVNVPGRGYVGVGEVISSAVRVADFKLKKADGTEIPITELPMTAPKMFDGIDDEELSEYFVAVKWLKTVPLAQAVKEKGFFGNQNTVCKPTTKKWVHTIERPKVRFGID